MLVCLVMVNLVFCFVFCAGHGVLSPVVTGERFLFLLFATLRFLGVALEERVNSFFSRLLEIRDVRNGPARKQNEENQT